MLSRHDAPRTPLELANDDGAARVEELRRAGLRVGWLTFGEQEFQGIWIVPSSKDEELPPDTIDLMEALAKTRSTTIVAMPRDPAGMQAPVRGVARA